MGLRQWLRDNVASGASAPSGDDARGRVKGDPPSGNGASSFHLFWQMPPARAPLVEVSAVFELLEPPPVDRLYFWALQASFVDERGVHQGAGHLGPQWNPGHAGRRAICWGGYGANGKELSGGPLAFPSPHGNPNVCDYPFPVGAPLTLRIRRSERGWLGEVIDGATGGVHSIRDLDCDTPYLADPVVWSEVFARCDHPTVRVRWSRLSGVGADGSIRLARAVSVNYQSARDGGCANTDSSSDGFGVVQATNVPRTVPQDAVIPLS
jgi:hypothetical protein